MVFVFPISIVSPPSFVMGSIFVSCCCSRKTEMVSVRRTDVILGTRGTKHWLNCNAANETRKVNRTMVARRLLEEVTLFRDCLQTAEFMLIIQKFFERRLQNIECYGTVCDGSLCSLVASSLR
mmetsp:Transcript_99480/g.201733  ORF Transcript_99480/g.201733 Transcript_99480/m.201733 type:complete len:123 (-) Transcript_99480:162-530(-)